MILFIRNNNFTNLFNKLRIHKVRNYSNQKVTIDATLVQKLVDKQFPQWKHLPIRPVLPGGWDNRTFHLGTTMLVRMPSSEEYASKVDKEQAWLPKLGPLLPLQIPKPLALGEPDNSYPWKWSVYNWINGETAATGHIENLSTLSATLANFINTFQQIDSSGGPIPIDASCFSHTLGLAYYDEEARRSINALKGKIDTVKATKVWDMALETTWKSKPVWVHGDISPSNLIVNNGKLVGVIDFGGLAIGDPSCDLRIAWSLLEEKSRKVFRSSLSLDDGTWARGRGWALWKASIIFAGLYESNYSETILAKRTIDEIIKDYKYTNNNYKPIIKF